MADEKIMRSSKSLAASGTISQKAKAKMDAKLAALKGTRIQNSMMAPFEQKVKDEGRKDHRGAGLDTDQINDRTFQDRGGKFGTPSKGGRAGSERQISANELDDRDEQGRKKFPIGEKARGKMTTPSRIKGTVAQSGPIYGGGDRNTQ